MNERPTAETSIKTILVDAEGGLGAARIKLAARLAQRLGANLLGVSVGQLRTFYAAEDAGTALPMLIEADREAIEADIASARTAFEQIAGGLGVPSEWRSGIANPAAFFAAHARLADLVVVGSPASAGVDSARRPDVGDLLMQAGRPVLVAPAAMEELSIRRILVAWKESHESRRAVRDALGLLQLADSVTLLAVGETDDEARAAEAALKDVQLYLERHGVRSSPMLRTGLAEDIINKEGETHDLTVAGAYGHSRLREWVFGGVTRSLLFYEPRCALLSR